MTIKSHSFLAAFDENIKFNIRFAGNAGKACCGGQGIALNSLTGTGIAFLVAAGTVLVRQLAAGEEMLASGHSIVAWYHPQSFILTLTFTIVATRQYIPCAPLVHVCSTVVERLRAYQCSLIECAAVTMYI